ncbi:MAG TPA: bacillithiol biosynthesis deacetylase BshB1 [Chloroflexi bacterium]|nr:bacillithiol biosynthesis deacetylase BshB1 [Chloroflexota bacterium]
MAVDILAIGAHPDDAEVGCAGLLLKAKARGLRTGILVLTRGEMGTFGDQETRVSEAQAAADILDVDAFRILDMPDAGLEFNYENTLQIVAVLKELHPRLVLSPHFDDRHPDHAATARLVERAVYLATRPAILPEHEPLIPQPRHLTFPLSFQRPCRPTFVLDITDVYGRKQKALQAHGSQYAPILFAVEIAARYYGMMITVAYGEGFLTGEPLPLTDDLGII